VSTLKLQHNKECKGLLVQIRYLKAKFTREALFRDHLGYQKQYLLEILSQFERGWGILTFSLSRLDSHLDEGNERYLWRSLA